MDATTATHGQLAIAPGATGTWHGGELGVLTLDIQRSAAGVPGKLILPAEIEGRSRVMYGVGIGVHGQMDWNAGDVSVANASSETSLIEVHGEGVFNIKAAGSWTGGGASFVVLNRGLVNKETASTSELGGDYLNVGTTHVKAGTLKHLGKVKVAAGVYKVDQGTTAWVRGWTDGLRVYNGELTGGGTVDGNVNLSFAPTETDLPVGVQTNAGAIHAVAGQILTIAGGLNMRSTSAKMLVDVLAAGTCSKVAVMDGPCILSGHLIVNKPATFQPFGGTFDFLTSTKAFTADFTTFLFDEASWNANDPMTNQSKQRSFQKEKATNTYSLVVGALGQQPPPGPPPPP